MASKSICRTANETDVFEDRDMLVLTTDYIRWVKTSASRYSRRSTRQALREGRYEEV